jgi:plasmid maintenance system killer protein
VDLKFSADRLRKLAYDRGFTYGLPVEVVTAYRMRMQAIESAPKESVLFSISAWLRLERIPHDSGHYSMHVTEDWQLLLGFEDGADERVAVVEAMVQLQKTIKEPRA